MKNIFLNNIIIFLLLLSFSFTAFSQNNDKCLRSRKAKKEAKSRWKLKKKEGWKPDVTYGDGISQYLNWTCRYQNSDDYYKETIESGPSKNRSLAAQKARQYARAALGKNMGSFLQAQIESGEIFINGNGEDITEELEMAVSTGAADEAFQNELKRNKVVMRFYRVEPGGFHNCEVSIAMSKKEFEKAIKKLKRKDLRDRIEKVRKTMRRKD